MFVRCDVTSNDVCSLGRRMHWWCCIGTLSKDDFVGFVRLEHDTGIGSHDEEY